VNIIKPMLAKQAELPKNDKEYGFEIKWDGMRVILYCQNDHIQILSRNQKDVTLQYPELKGIATAKRQFILDGEIVYFDYNGKPSFSGLQHRMGLSETKSIESRMKEYPVNYIIFDILSLQEESTLNLPYIVRRETLKKLNLEGPAWQTPDYKLGSGSEMMSAIRQMGLEGIIAKRLTSIYSPDKRNGDWLKIKNKQRQELVIGGWISGKGGRHDQIGALLLGYYDKHQLKYAGKVGTGFTLATLEHLKSLMAPIAIKQNPFDSSVPHREAMFVQPVFVCEIEFTEWTSHSTLRHPSFKGLRMDKSAYEVVRE